MQNFVLNENKIKPTAFTKFTYNVQHSKWKPGLSVGINFNNFSGTLDDNTFNKYRTGYNIGFFMDYTKKETIPLGNSTGEINKYDYGIKAGISFSLGSFEPSFGYELGLNNLSNTTGEKTFNRGFYFNWPLIFGK